MNRRPGDEAAAGEWVYGRQVIRMTLGTGARRRPTRLVATSAAAKALGLGRLPPGLRVVAVEARELDRLTGSREHQGVAALVPAFAYAEPDDVLAGDLVVALDEVSDPRNVGAVARSALAAGASGLVVPRHRSAAVTPAAVKASAGATEILPIAQVTNLVAFLRRAKERGFWVYGAQGSADRSYLNLDLRVRSALVLGSEGHGLRRLVAETCDQLAAIPMNAALDSLNVSVAAAILLFEARRQRTADLN